MADLITVRVGQIPIYKGEPIVFSKYEVFDNIQEALIYAYNNSNESFKLSHDIDYKTNRDVITITCSNFAQYETNGKTKEDNKFFNKPT